MGLIERALTRARGLDNRAVERKQAPNAPIVPPQAGGSVELDIGTIRRVELDLDLLTKNRVVATGHRSAAGEAFKMLRTRVRRAMESQKLTTLAVSSAAANDGKTLVAVNLAFAMAAETKGEVILVDFDLRNPSVGKTLGLDPSLPGLTSYLRDEARLQEICLCPSAERLAVVSNAETFDNSSEILGSMKIGELVAELRGRGTSRIVIFDLPPLLHTDDFLAFSAHVDALLMVTCEGKTKRQELAEAFDLLDGVNVIGTVLNKSFSQADTYYYS